MLKYLHIENIAVIESADIEFSDGFNVLTGETGAGKSIIIDSINAVLGERTSKDLIRSGCDSATVSAQFCDIGEDALKVLTSLDIFPDDDGSLLIVRKLSQSGKGYIKIAGKPVTAGELRSVATELINIHGQHDNKALLNPEKHCGFIDKVAENGELLSLYYSEFKALNAVRRELSSLENDEDSKAYETDMLKYKISEIEKADIKPGEAEKLKEQIKLAENAENIRKAFDFLISSLTGNEETDGIINSLKKCRNCFTSIKSGTEFSDISSKIEELISASDELKSAAVRMSSDCDFLDFDINTANQRLDLLQKLMLKYGNSEQEILKVLEDSRNRLEQITFAHKRITELSEKLEKAKEKLIDSGKLLSDSRNKAAEAFANKVCETLRFLNMPGVEFSVSKTADRYTKNGCDKIEFLISANKGEEMKPLHKIASGGELSRVMLAIISVLLEIDSVGTMIFDEIDSGISGYAAERVAVKLKEVSRKRQVICITHLAQIAAKADSHILIEKYEKDRTYTEVTLLDNEGRINELARIMSGSEITDNLYNSAKELLNRSQSYENL